MNKLVTALAIVLTLSSGITTSASGASIGLSFTRAANDFQRDMNRIVENIRSFNENSSKAGYANSMKQMKQISATNDALLKGMSISISTFKNNLNKNKKFLPTKDISESPKFSTLAKMAMGYENWLKYQKMNQKMFKRCFRNTNNKFNSFKNCTLNNFGKSFENERLGRVKLEQAVREYNLWMARFGHSK